MVSRDPVERLASVVINLGLADRMMAGTLTVADGRMILGVIRGGPPFPWTDDQILTRLVAVGAMAIGDQMTYMGLLTGFRIPEDLTEDILRDALCVHGDVEDMDHDALCKLWHEVCRI